MKSICMCDEHKQMIKNLRMDELMELSNQQSSMTMQLDELITGLDDPLYDFAAVVMEWKGTPLADILKNFKSVRDNAQKVFDIVQEEIKIRLDEVPSHRDRTPLATRHSQE